MATTKASTTKSTKAAGRAAVRPFPRTLAGNVPPASDTNREALLEDYKRGIELMQQGRMKEAHTVLESLLNTAPPELLDRIRMYMSACIAHSQAGATEFATPEEQYDYAVSLLNDRQFEDAREHLDQVLQREPNADYAFYGMALLAALTGDAAGCLKHLATAIDGNALNRLHARNDPDFRNMVDDPRFTELLYPEA